MWEEYEGRKGIREKGCVCEGVIETGEERAILRKGEKGREGNKAARINLGRERDRWGESGRGAITRMGGNIHS